MLSPRNAPAAPATMTANSGYGASPVATATPPMMTVVSLGTIGITESRKAIDEDDAEEPPVAGPVAERVGEVS